MTPTEVHRRLIADIEARSSAEFRDHFAKLTITSAQLADSNVGLRQECDQLRAENKAIHHELNESRNAERLARMQLDLARAERDAERARLDWLDLRAPKCWGLIDAQMLAGKTETIRAAIDAAMKEGK